MDRFHIGRLAEKRISQVSGGQLQRACICRSMMMDPEILFADEPTGALNQTAALEVMEAFLDINQKGGSVLMVTHDSRVAAMCQRILYILDGELKGELQLGKYADGDLRVREEKTAGWLKELGW